ncbi:MAG: S-layer homology domain-containing protein, partial [Candidatus Cryosericum sp.]
MKRVICVLLVLALCTIVMAPASTARAAGFADVPASRWSFGFVEAAAKAGYVSGIGAGKFDPEATIKRQDVAVLLT